LEQYSSVRSLTLLCGHIVNWDLQGAKLSLDVKDSPEDMPFALDAKAFGDSLKVREQRAHTICFVGCDTDVCATVTNDAECVFIFH
jgi:hypothetical protein